MDIKRYKHTRYTYTKKGVGKMASVNWQKQTKQKAGAMNVHLGKKERVEKEHSNPDIDKSKSHLNIYIGCDDYQEAYQKMCKHTDEVDKLYPPKRVAKDRVICESLECPCPMEIFNQGRSEEFFKGLHEIYCKSFGEENVHGTSVHLDEMHLYKDKDGIEKMSLPHSHTLVSCYAEWQDKDGKRQGINGKNFEKKSNYNKLNNLIQDYCKETFGVDFLTGETPQKKSVEVLKAEELEHEIRAKQQALNKVQDKALAYEQPPKKFFTESKEAYECRIETGKQAIAVKQQTEKAKAEQLKAKIDTDRAAEKIKEANQAMEIANRNNENVMMRKKQLEKERTQLELEKSKQPLEISSKVKQALAKEGYQTDYTAQAEQARQQAIRQHQIEQTKHAARAMKQKGIEYGR